MARHQVEPVPEIALRYAGDAIRYDLTVPRCAEPEEAATRRRLRTLNDVSHDGRIEDVSRASSSIGRAADF
jgi:hypothetical protein